MIKIELFEILIAIYILSLIINSILWMKKKSHLKKLINLGKTLLAGVHSELNTVKYIDGTIQIVGNLNNNLPNITRLNNEYENWISEVSKYYDNVGELFYNSVTIPLTVHDDIIELQKKHDIEIILTGMSKGIPLLEKMSKQLPVTIILLSVLNTFPNILQGIGIPINKLAKFINILCGSIIIYGTCEKIIFPIINKIL